MPVRQAGLAPRTLALLGVAPVAWVAHHIGAMEPVHGVVASLGLVWAAGGALEQRREALRRSVVELGGGLPAWVWEGLAVAVAGLVCACVALVLAAPPWVATLGYAVPPFAAVGMQAWRIAGPGQRRREAVWMAALESSRVADDVDVHQLATELGAKRGLDAGAVVADVEAFVAVDTTRGLFPVVTQEDLRRGIHRAELRRVFVPHAGWVRHESRTG